MALILNKSDWEELLQQTPVPEATNLAFDGFDKIKVFPEILGRGYYCCMNTMPGLWLDFLNWQVQQDVFLRTPAHDHPIGIMISLSGFVCFDNLHPIIGGRRGYFSGSGVCPGLTKKYSGGEHFKAVNVEMEPELLKAFFLEDGQYGREFEKLLFRGEDFKKSFYPTVTLAMRSVAEQMWNVPYRGAAKRMYLQGKALELMAMYLDLIYQDRDKVHALPKLKSSTVARIYHAKDILTTELENPPTLTELSQKVGVSVRTLQRGFPSIFNTTAIKYSQQQRLEKAKILLRQGNCQVAEVANIVGYSHLSRFAAAFKKQFGITPSECLAGKKAALG